MSLLDQIESDLDTFINNDDFAKEVTYTPSGGDAVTIDAIFDAEFEALNLQTGAVETSRPQITVKDSDVSGVAQGDTVVIDSTTYYIRGIQPDGTGLTILVLSED